MADPETGKPVRLAYPQRMFGQERESVTSAYPGDIIGLVAHRSFRIGDTLATDPKVKFREIPRFPPEVFAHLRNPNPSKSKQFKEGLGQLLNEGVIQTFHLTDSVTNIPLLGAVGQLQFEVVVYRLKNEYGAEAILEPAPFREIRWFSADVKKEQLQDTFLGSGVKLAEDIEGDLVILFPDRWSVDYFLDKNPKYKFFHVSPTANPVHQSAG